MAGYFRPPIGPRCRPGSTRSRAGDTRHDRRGNRAPQRAVFVMIAHPAVIPAEVAKKERAKRSVAMPHGSFKPIHGALLAVAAGLVVGGEPAAGQGGGGCGAPPPLP